VSSAVSSFVVPGSSTAEMTAAAFDRCSAGLYRYLVVRLDGNAHAADDLMQQLWLHAQQLSDTPPGEVEFRLRAIAKNLIRTHWRKQGRRPAQLPLAEPRLAAELARRLVCEELPVAILERKEVRDQLLLALTELPAAEQELIIKHYFHGKPHAELAATLGTSERAIEGRLYRARATLREKLQHWEPT